MIQRIHCSQCGNDGLMPVTFQFDFNHRRCGECGQHKEDSTKFWFCRLRCFQTWVLKNMTTVELTVPCQFCSNTGYASGFKQNGPCRVCNGTLQIKDPV